MKRMTWRTLALVLGVMLGWYAAGQLPSTEPLYGQAAPPEVAVPAVDGDEHTPAAEGEPDMHADDEHPGGEGERAGAGDDHGEHDDAGLTTAAQLRPATDAEISFYRPVLIAAFAFFAAAIAIGLLNRAMGYRDPGIVASEQDQAEAHHGHDAHDSHDDHSDAGHGEGHAAHH